MAAKYTAVIQQHGEWWIGWIEEIPGVNSQGHTRAELLDDLRARSFAKVGVIPGGEIQQTNGEPQCRATRRCRIRSLERSVAISAFQSREMAPSEISDLPLPFIGPSW